MSFGAILVGVGLLFLSIFAIAGPWRRSTEPAQAAEAVPLPETTPSALEARRDAAYAALGDLDFDHRLGKLNTDDYHTVRSQLLSQAIAALKGLDAATDLEGQIDALVRSRRAGVQTNGHGPHGQRSPATGMRDQNAHHTQYCMGCGVLLGPNDRFCRTCGLQVAGRCSRCGAAVHDQDRFCTGCGSSLAGEAVARGVV